MNDCVIEVKELVKQYHEHTKVLDRFSFQFKKGTFYAIMGRSGAGKSTLLNIIGTIDEPTSGEVLVEGIPLSGMTEKEKAEFRMKYIGFVFQGFYLNPYINAVENVMIPMRINPEIPPKNRRELALALLDNFGVAGLEQSYPSQMSGGEQQRVCIARALANNPKIILADEPTGNLDSENEKIVFSYLKQLSEQGHVIITVSHNEKIKEYADEVIVLE